MPVGELGGTIAGALIGSVIPVVGTIGGGIIGYLWGNYNTKQRLEAEHAYEIEKLKAKHGITT